MMPKIPAVLLWIIFLTASSLAAGDPPFHDLSLVLDPAGGKLAVTDRLTLEGTGRSILNFALDPALQVDNVTLGGEPVPWTWTRSQGRLLVGPLPQGSGPMSLDISYRGEFSGPVPRDPLDHDDPSYGVTAAVTPAGTFLGNGWYPSLPDQPARFRIRVLAPPGTWAVTAGRLVERGENPRGTISVWVVDTPLPSLALSAGPYHIEEALGGQVPVYAYFGAANAPLAPSYLGAAQDYLAFYQDLFGPYPFPKFAIVENFFPTGYGFPSWTLLGSSVVRLPFILNTSLPHEIAHSWWGTGVRVAPAFGNWSEGLATYVADYLLQERTSAAAAREYRLKILREYATLVAPEFEFPLEEFSSRRSKGDQAVGYGKGAMVFHMARRRVGDSAFWEGLRKVADQRMFAQASWQDFAAAFDHGGKADMEKFVRQWVERSGAPDLRLADVAMTRTAGGWQVAGRLTQSPPYYFFDTALLLETTGEAVSGRLSVRDGSTAFKLTSPSPPRRLLVDPEADVFRRLAPEEIPPTVNTLRREEPLLVVFAQGQKPRMESAVRDLLVGLGREATMIEEGGIESLNRPGQDLLLVGWPRNPALRPELPAGFTLGEAGFTLEGRHFSDAQAGFFAVLPRSPERQDATGLLLAFSAEGGRMAARKIPHYGKYSYVAFSNGENIAKGTWPTARSPLIIEFPDGQQPPGSP